MQTWRKRKITPQMSDPYLGPDMKNVRSKQYVECHRNNEAE
jgi:hypothetical protein